MKSARSSAFTLTVLTFFALYNHSVLGLGLDWKADKSPTHTLDHVTAILKPSSGDPSNVNIVLHIDSTDTGDQTSYTVANNVGVNSGTQSTFQVPNEYPGTIPSGMDEEDYFARSLRYRFWALNPSSNEVIARSDEFVIFWTPRDGTPTPTKMGSQAANTQSTSSNSGTSSSSDNSSSSSSNNNNNNNNNNSNSNNNNNNNNNNANTSSSTATPATSSSDSSGNNGGNNAAQAAASSGSTASSPASTLSSSSSGTALSQDSTITHVSVAPATTIYSDGSTIVNAQPTATTTSTTVTGASKGKNMTPIIIGVVSGVVALLLLGLGLFACLRHRRKKSKEKTPESGVITPATWSEQGNPPNGSSAHRGSLASTSPRIWSPSEPSEGGGTILGALAGSFSPRDGEEKNPGLVPANDATTTGRFESKEAEAAWEREQAQGQQPDSFYTNGTHPNSFNIRLSGLSRSPPPEYTRRSELRSSQGTIDQMLVNVA